MPHIPRRISPTTGVPPELMQRPGAAHAPIPLPAERSGKREATPPETPQGRRRKIGLSTLSPRTYEPDQKQILRTLFGKEPYVDPNTGQLVLAVKPSRTGNAQQQ